MAWKIKLGDDFLIGYLANPSLKDDFDYGINVIIETEDHHSIPETAHCPGYFNRIFYHICGGHEIIFKVIKESHTVEFVNCY